MAHAHVNFLGGSPLNRLSWLRSSQDFLNAIAGLPQTRWVLFNAGFPLVGQRDGVPYLAYLSTKEVKPILGSEPFFGQGKEIGTHLQADEVTTHTEAARHLNNPVVFLGLHENHNKTGALPSSDFADAQAAVKNIEGTAYFSLDVASLDKSSEELEAFLQSTETASNGVILSFSEPRSVMNKLDLFTSGVFAEARSMVDWNERNKFCPGCGSPLYSMWGGWKLACSTLLPWASKTNKKTCITAKGLHNFTHPRSDPVVIMIAVDETGDRILLGRNKKFPGKFYSALAGFVEPGESFEDAVLREMWEEAGVKVWDVRYHSGQPWPYPASLMVGFYARADASAPIRVDLDNELEDAQWYDRSAILSIINHPDGTNLSPKTFNDEYDGKTAGTDLRSKPIDAPPFRVPPTTAIAGVLIRDWAEGKIGFDNDKKGKL
ncbi:hypothetical protein ARMGADRAFT_1019389 [Armillaria gallica]|uniref:NAD(+) diphosphatase n=1 Tax=Armillaria gallica TaxID=47427 RepID=A0A2H3CI68_ARMGA|nr:hypothetical protein ARMGADRAFT_1019389 [Armillaria gallica]